jgi:hypothetical protein
MTTKEINKQSKEMKEAVKKITTSKAEARKFLASTGIYTEKGNLKKRYKCD